MSGASTSVRMSPQLSKVAERARNEPEGRFNSLAHLIDVPALKRAFGRLRKNAAVGIDGVSKDDYGRGLQANLHDLHERLKTKRYRHQAIRRVHIPKPNGKTRLIGVSTIEDKIVQDALREVLETVYEEDFLDCSYGARPGRSAHDALRELDRVVFRGNVNWILEADISSFFDSVDRTALRELLQVRIADGSMHRLIGKCLHAGVLDGSDYSEPEEGTPQGSVLSPLIGNVYLHYVLDLWFERDVRPRLRGQAHLVRYCDDFVVAFECWEDAERVMDVLGKRFGRFGLKLHPDKTRLLPFERPRRGGNRPSTFDFVGFTIYWRRTRSGRWCLACKTRRASLKRAIASLCEWCRHHRHLSVKDQHAALTRRVRGHFNYFGVNGNYESLEAIIHSVERAWLKWLQRRSNRSRLTWKRFQLLLGRFPLPVPKIVVQIW